MLIFQGSSVGFKEVSCVIVTVYQHRTYLYSYLAMQRFCAVSCYIMWILYGKVASVQQQNKILGHSTSTQSIVPTWPSQILVKKFPNVSTHELWKNVQFVDLNSCAFRSYAPLKSGTKLSYTKLPNTVSGFGIRLWPNTGQFHDTPAPAGSWKWLTIEPNCCLCFTR